MNDFLLYHQSEAGLEAACALVFKFWRKRCDQLY